MRTSIRVVLAAALAAASAWGVGVLRHGAGAAAEAAEHAHAAKYFCPMHPTIVRSEPGRCPICGMDLQALEEEPAAATPTATPGHASFRLDAARRQAIGVTTARVERRVLERVLRVPGRMAFDPELYTAIEEYRQAKDAGASRGLLRSIETRLGLLGLTETQISELAARRGPPTELLLGTRGGGPDWVYADLYQSEVGVVQAGQAVEVESTALPGRVFRGRVRAVDPVVNPVTRTARVRITLTEAPAALKPETYLDVRIHAPLGTRLAVPEDAVLEGGEKAFAFVLHEDGLLEPRPVRPGRRAEGFVEVLTGLVEGETVVSSANFLIDSESRLRAAIAGFGGEGAPAHAH